MQSELKSQSSWVNPYRELLGDFPGKIFCFDDARDTDRVRELVRQAKAVYCEIGSGSGKHAILLGQREQHAQVFGFELRYKRAVRTVQKAVHASVDNVYVLRTHGELLAEIFPEGSVAGVFVNFPDPWEKAKRRKHRILSSALLNDAARVLTPEGFLSAKTDHLEYFRSFHAEACTDARFSISEQTEDLYSSTWIHNNLPTEFESLFIRQGLPICYLKLIRRTD